MAVENPKVGQWESGKPVFPELTISGREYERPCTTRGIGEGLFVVVDMRPSVDVDAEIAAILAARKPVRKVRPALVEITAEGNGDEPETDRP